MPEISLPDIRLPEIRFRNGNLPDVKLPDIDLRERLADVDLSKLSLPSAIRDFSMSDVSMPDVHMSDVHMPDLRDMKTPKVDLSGFDTKRLRALSPFAKPAPKSASPLPWIVVAGAAGLAAGWFLATSPMARTFADRLRARIAAWRSARAEWEDTEGRSEGFWSTEDGWKQDGSARGEGPDAAESASDTSAGPSGWEGAASVAVVASGPDDAIGGTGYEASPEGDASEREG
jgi:hypothetical protein